MLPEKRVGAFPLKVGVYRYQDCGFKLSAEAAAGSPAHSHLE